MGRGHGERRGGEGQEQGLEGAGAERHACAVPWHGGPPPAAVNQSSLA